MNLHIHTLILLSCCFLCSFCHPLQAQTLNGIVTDAETGLPMEAVMISILNKGVMTDYTLTDAQGKYSLPWNYSDTRQVKVSILGYKQEVRNLSASGRQNFRLQPQSIVLKEVEIRPGRIYGRKDTIRYDLSQFASSKDVHIKDVLRKLPGVEVEENGEVKYKGKTIDHFLVEGMDVTGGRYNQVNNNLSAKAVKTAEFMENYQSVKALKGKINSDKVALNLKLDPKARDQWIVNGMLGSGADASGKILWKGSASALQLGKGRQSLYSYKTNNNGTDLSTEQTRFTSNNDRHISNVSPLLIQPGISAPLDKKRLLFNKTHTVNGNCMFKPDAERSLRLQAGYTHDQIKQERNNTQSYYQPGDTLCINETYQYLLQSNAAYAEIYHENNSREHYLSNRFRIEGETERSTSQELEQQIHTSQLKANNTFRLLRNKNNHTWEFNSILQYTLLPSLLQVEQEKEKYQGQNLYTDNSVTYLRKHNGFTRQYKAGIQGEWNNYSGQSAVSHNISSFSVYMSPYFQLERRQWLGSLSLPIRSRQFVSSRKNYILYSPSFYLRYQVDYHWKFSFFASLNRSTGSGTGLYPLTYRTDYRTWRNNNGLIPLRLNQDYQLYGEYKNTVQEFFITASLNYHRTRRNTIYEQSLSQDTIVYTQRAIANHTESRSFSTTLSKGFYDWHLKTSLHLSLSRSSGLQFTNRLLQTYRYDYLKAEPKITWLPIETFEAEYHAIIGYGGSKIGNDTRLTPLLDFVQRLQLTFSIGALELRLAGEHYRNDLGGNTHLNTILADATIIYKVKKWRLEANLNNLFNKKEYAYTVYSTTQSYTSRLGIRPREAMITTSYQF
ncbi:carboxypeptidase-like regulatory domain-containing protein [uncultured Bacteroides sp.]|uniref:carboxypeptidase-like regulatory domain-containing protein n=1 Tax=uncultured Bacteroides sp. TaxID=162156 RepID=UPI0025ED5D38|nr:carboxypeptidase-like regulatory domain-containing protein [uncultured Bacteroides sp.]